MRGYKDSFTISEIESFMSYVHSFYGDGSIYDFNKSDSKSGGVLTDLEIYKAMELMLNTDHTWGGGDTLDREVVRDIMLAQRRGGDTSDLEFSFWLLEQQLDWGGVV